MMRGRTSSTSAISTRTEDGNPNVKVEYDPLELLDFLKQNFVHMNAVCERAGMFDRHVEARTDAVFEFFGLMPAPSSGN